VVSSAVTLAQELAGSLADELPRLVGVGAALPGHVDHARGRVVYGQNLKSIGDSWRDVGFASMLADAFGAPAAIDNDVNCMLIYQHELGPRQSEGSFVLVYLAADMEGIGSGILNEGSIVRGGAGCAGEFGHLVVQPGGPRCPCGNRGCLQAVVGGATIIRDVNWGRRHAVEQLSDAALLAEQGDARAVAAFVQAGRSFGQGLSILLNLLNPPLIVIGGPPEIVGQPGPKAAASPRRIAHPKRGRRKPSSAELFRRGFEETLREYTFGDAERGCRIEVDHVTVEMAARGAALLGLEAAERAVERVARIAAPPREPVRAG
jgi:predicted NBD/HSP70 family sugar kinase